QPKSPIPPNIQQGVEYRCGRCGRSGHKPEICAAPRRFEGHCGACTQFGHMRKNCAINGLSASPAAPPHVHAIAPAGAAGSAAAHGWGGGGRSDLSSQQLVVDQGGDDIP
ncbi:unnamed protein product, partial [Pylaiella littoralis]